MTMLDDGVLTRDDVAHSDWHFTKSGLTNSFTVSSDAPICRNARTFSPYKLRTCTLLKGQGNGTKAVSPRGEVRCEDRSPSQRSLCEMKGCVGQ